MRKLANLGDVILLGLAVLLAGCATPARQTTAATVPTAHYKLTAEQFWQLNLPRGERFDASGLLLTPTLELFTVEDRRTTIYQIKIPSTGSAADLLPLTNRFTPTQLALLAREKIDRYDIEGIAQDEQKRIYLCEEANRWVLRWDPKTKQVERLEIDWSPVQKYFHPTDRNASFEGIAVGQGRLYLANERTMGRIIVVDLAAMKVIDDFVAWPSGSFGFDVHYTDLCWFEGALYVLLREKQAVLKVDPASHRVLAEYDYQDLENTPETNYHRIMPLVGLMEGLAVDRDHIWLVTDNNGLGRVRYPKDIRPTLFKCPRPDKAGGTARVIKRNPDTKIAGRIPSP